MRRNAKAWRENKRTQENLKDPFLRPLRKHCVEPPSVLHPSHQFSAVSKTTVSPAAEALTSLAFPFTMIWKAAPDGA